MKFSATSSLFTLALVVPLIFSNPSRRADFPDCLNSSSTNNPFHPSDHSDCNNDALDQGNDETIRQGEKLFDINPKEIRFVGCYAAPFLTLPGSGLTNSQFTIYYPTGNQIARDSYAAPLLHEMGHVFQLKQAGSYQKLKDALGDSKERIELGADFIAGLGANHLGLKPAAFEINLSLVGSYNIQDTDPHGTPANRSAAFRNGYFYHEKATIADSYDDFQDNLFAQIKHQ